MLRFILFMLAVLMLFLARPNPNWQPRAHTLQVEDPGNLPPFPPPPPEGSSGGGHGGGGGGGW
jgi:hypothetical protein